MPEFIDPVFAKTSPKHLFSMIGNMRVGLAFAKTRSIIRAQGDIEVFRVKTLCMCQDSFPGPPIRKQPAWGRGPESVVINDIDPKTGA